MFKFDSHTSINGVTPGYSEPGSSDLARFSHPDSDLTLDWTNEGKEGGLSRTSGVSAIYNTPEITAKNITVIATQKGNQWNDKGIVYNGTGHNGKITAAGTITVRTNDDCIYTESNGHHIEISGFRKMVLESTGTPSFFQGSSGYVIMNNGTNNFLTITGGENSEIEMTNKGGRAVVADNSSSAGSTKTKPFTSASGETLRIVLQIPSIASFSSSKAIIFNKSPRKIEYRRFFEITDTSYILYRLFDSK